MQFECHFKELYGTEFVCILNRLFLLNVFFFALWPLTKMFCGILQQYNIQQNQLGDFLFTLKKILKHPYSQATFLTNSSPITSKYIGYRMFVYRSNEK